MAHSGSAASATTLASTPTQSIGVRASSSVLTAKLSAYTVKIVLTDATMAAHTTRSTSRQWSRNNSTTGMRATVVCSNTGVSSSLRRIRYPTTTTITLAKKGIRHPQASRSSSGNAATGRNAAVAMI